MKRIATIATVAILTVLASGAASADGFFITDRLGYTGSIVHYATLGDALARINSLDTVTVGNRDISLGLVNNYSMEGWGLNETDILGSWWYTTQGSAGYGNTRGNVGIGFMQLYDTNGSTRTSATMGFTDGTYSAYNVKIAGENATSASDYARLSAYDNVHDAGTYLSYALDITVSGLEGVRTGDVIEATNHPTGVDGTFTGLFQFGGDPDGDLYTGYYTVDLTYDMTNWAYSNNGSLNGPYQDGGNIYPSDFMETVPEPFSMVMLGCLGGGMALARKLRRKSA